MSRAASDRPRIGLVSFVVAALLGAAQLAAGCVDGVTPDCSDPAVCAPSQGDAALGGDGSAVVPEAGPSADDGEAGLDGDTDAADAADADGG